MLLLQLLVEQAVSVAAVADLANFLTPAAPDLSARGEPLELVDTTLWKLCTLDAAQDLPPPPPPTLLLPLELL
jgi:hypothetical protein